MHGSPEPVSTLLRHAAAGGVFPGAAFGIAQGGAVLALGSVGRFTHDPLSPPVTPSTAYDLASVTKVAATACMAMLLFERGLLNLDWPLKRLLPGFAGGEAVTVRLLLAHASGLPAYAPFFERCRGREEVLRAALALPLAYTPGAETRYSDPGFILLGAALEALAGQPLDRFCEREIFGPLGMTATRFRPPAAERGSVPPTEESAAQGVVHDENCRAMGGVCGHAGLFAPVADLLRCAEAMLAPLHGRGSPLVSRGTVELFTRRAGLPAGSSRALGWDTPSGELSSAGSRMSGKSFGHLGYTGTSLWVDPQGDISIVLLTNRTFPTRHNEAIRQLRPRFHDEAVKLFQYEIRKGEEQP